MPGREVFGEVGAFGISKRRTASASTWEEGYVCCLRFTGAVRNLSDLNEAVVGCGVFLRRLGCLGLEVVKAAVDECS